MTGFPPCVELEHAPCPLRCDGGDVAVLTGRDRLHNLPGEFTIVRCRTCGLLRTDPRPTSATMGFYYPETYGPHRKPESPAPSAAKADWPAWKRLARRSYRFLRYDMYRFRTEALPDLPKGRLFEFGCGSGSFLLRMATAGWEVEGLEFSERAAEVARSLGLNVRTGTLEGMCDPSVPYDLAVGWMTLEHLQDPLLGLLKLRRWVRPGGWLAFSIPNAGSLDFRLFGGASYALQLPTHLYHFTTKTVALLLERSGWEKECILHQRVLGNLAASTAIALQDRGVRNRLTQFLADYPEAGGRNPYRLYPLACLLAAFGQTGRMTVWARRRSD